MSKTVDITREYKKMLGLPIITSILERLRTELSHELTYHNVDHTLDVLHESILFAVMDKRTDEEIRILSIAAAYHEAGFLVSPKRHELTGSEIAKEAMKKFGMEQEACFSVVPTLILDTKLKLNSNGSRCQVPRHALSGYLLDGDLSNLGRSDFFEKMEQVRSEGKSDQLSSMKLVHEIMRAHSWQTEPARKLRNSTKQANMELLRERIAALEGTT